MSTGSAARCGLNSTVPARAAWKTPSPHWENSRVASSRRKSPRRSTWPTPVPTTCTRSPYGPPPTVLGAVTSRLSRAWTDGPPVARTWGTLVPMTPVPSSSDPESGRPVRPATGRRRAPAVPSLSIGCLDDVRPGSLLVAMPALTDPTFAGTVVYVLDHSVSGTLGVVLGRPSQVEIRDVLPGWCDLAVDPEVFHVGGPCETDTALCLAVSPAAAADVDSPLRRVAGDVYLVDLDSDPAELTD